MNTKDIEQLQQLAAGLLGLSDLSKDALIELHREAFGNVGDTVRQARGNM